MKNKNNNQNKAKNCGSKNCGSKNCGKNESHKDFSHGGNND